MDVGVATSLSCVDGLNGDGVGDSDGDRDGKEGGSGGSVCSILRGVDAAVTGVGVVGETEDRGSEGNDTSGCGRGGNG
jgi:hypothetical protein